MAKALKASLLALLIAGIVTSLIWAVTIHYWRDTHRAITSEDIVVYLVVLPLALVGGLLLLRWIVKRSQAPALPAAGAAGAATAATPAAAPGDEAERRLQMQILATAVRLPAGSDAAGALAKALDGSQRPKPDGELKDDDGLPIFAARAEDADAEATREELQHLAPEREPSESLVRALGLLRAPLAQLIDAIGPYADRFAPRPRPVPGSQEPLPPPPPRLRIVLAVPAQWPEAERGLAQTWMQLQCRQAPLPPDSWKLATLAPDGPDGLWQELDRLFVQLHRDHSPDPLLLVAADSSLDPARIHALERAGRLFSPKRPKGVIVGEAAAGLLLAPLSWQATAAEGPVVRLHRPALARRDKSADASGRLAADTLAQALRDALQVAGLAPPQVGLTVSDADQRAERLPELLGATMQVLPDLEPGKGCAQVGAVCGEMGPAGSLACIALAAAHAAAENVAVVAVSVADAHARLAMAVVPPPAAS
jgi:hypothetical protein